MIDSMVVARFEELVSWYTIIVHDCELKEPYNDWWPPHVRQGFAWRPGTVSFATLDIVVTSIEVRLEPEHPLETQAVRAIRVPFRVGRTGVKIASTASQNVVVPQGDYSLIFEHGWETPESRLWTRLTFDNTSSQTPAVLIADPELSPPDPLVMTADPA